MSLRVKVTKTATCAISFNKTLGVKTPPTFFSVVNLYRNDARALASPAREENTYDVKSQDLTLWNKPLGFSSMNNKSKISAMERAMLRLTPRVRSIIIGLILSDG